VFPELFYEVKEETTQLTMYTGVSRTVL